MRVLIATVQVPFVRGGAEMHAEGLQAALTAAGHQVEQVKLPFKWYPPEEIMRGALAWRMLDVTEANGRPVDLVVGMKFPAYTVAHPRKVLWVIHQYRSAYNLWGTPFDDLSTYPDGARVRDLIRHCDERFIPEARKVFANSRAVADRLARYNALPGTPLYPPPHHLGRYRDDGPGDYLFYAGRLDRLKRLDLAIDAMKRVRGGAKLKIAGAGPLAEELRKQIAGLGVADRVELLGFVDAEALIDLYAGCRAAYYAPLNEDYGYVTVEAFLSRKPVVTTSDAGGPLEFVTHGETGAVAEPDPEAIAAAIDALWAQPVSRLREMGEAGRARVEDITWDHVIDRLTESLR
jgi:glycosyltransferase involved in cell wall biosynthesis